MTTRAKREQNRKGKKMRRNVREQKRDEKRDEKRREKRGEKKRRESGGRIQFTLNPQAGKLEQIGPLRMN